MRAIFDIRFILYFASSGTIGAFSAIARHATRTVDFAGPEDFAGQSRVVLPLNSAHHSMRERCASATQDARST
jgi:hypothetical protein